MNGSLSSAHFTKKSWSSQSCSLFKYCITTSKRKKLDHDKITANNAVINHRRVAEIQIFEKTYLIVIKDETCLKFKMSDSTLFLIGSYAQKLVASY